MKTTYIGQAAEAAVAKYLAAQAFEVIARNWRRPKCEIDIVANKKGVAYFIEVKYRSNPAQGAGFEYVTFKKLRQMRFAAEVWVQENNWSGDYRLAAAAVSGDDYLSIELVEV